MRVPEMADLDDRRVIVRLLLSLPVLLLGDTTCGAIASQKCPPAVNTTVTTATNLGQKNQKEVDGSHSISSS